jgi:hypothetical protein
MVNNTRPARRLRFLSPLGGTSQSGKRVVVISELWPAKPEWLETRIHKTGPRRSTAQGADAQ